MREDHSMLVLLGGFRGSGKRKLAIELARQRGFHWYDIWRHQVFGAPSTDIERLFVYSKIVRDFSLLSKMYSGVVLSDGLHRKKPREFLVEKSKDFFSEVAYVWIDSHRSDFPEKTKEVRSRMIAEYEPDPLRPIFFNEGPPFEKPALDLWCLIEKNC
ncbi:MAG: hypothetical protein Q8R25_00165 [bacterium]|nr:hypothetical protein [bacterium]